MPLLDLTDQEAQWLTNMLATHDFPWIYTNPLLNKLAAAQQQKEAPHGGFDQERRVALDGNRVTQVGPDNGIGPTPTKADIEREALARYNDPRPARN